MGEETDMEIQNAYVFDNWFLENTQRPPRGKGRKHRIELGFLMLRVQECGLSYTKK